MLKFFTSALTIFCLIGSASGQIYSPVDWSFSTEHIEGDVYELTFQADIDDGWAIYTQHIVDDNGPLPTEFNFEEGTHYTLQGEVQEPDNARTAYDPVFEMDLTKFYKSAPFKQTVEVSDVTKPITGYLVFMTCNDERCLPPTDVDFSFSVKARNGNEGSGEDGSDAGDAGEISKIAGADTAEESDAGASGNVEQNWTDLEGESNDAPGLYDPVSWSTDFEKKNAGTYVLKVRADIEDGWYIYSQHIDGDGPIPTTLYFDEIEGVEYVGETAERGAKRVEEYDRYFRMDLVKFKESAIFEREALVEPHVERITGELEYMVCNDERCLPSSFVSFAFQLDESQAPGPVGDEQPLDADINVVDQSIPTIQNTYEDPVGDCHVEQEEEEDSMLWTFVLGFLGGLLALLTPCVFPMIPLTVSFFSKDTKRKGWVNGGLYGGSIIVIYVAVGLLITAFFGATALNELSTNWIANTIFFLIFVAFAFSFFGFYEIQLPSSWANKSDRMADKGGLVGIFFMAFTLAIVSFSCTGPIIGSAIVQSATSAAGPFVVMLGFSTALALPFGLFAAFPAWLNSLPQSGSWMNSVKVVLGFLELALAFKFLSVADMTSHWDFLRYELFLGVWILVAIGMALYLFGVIRFPHDSPVRKLSVTRLGLALGMSALALYMMTGFLPSERTGTYNALPMLSGLAPPAHYNFFQPVQEPDPLIKERFPSYSKCANNLDCFHDYYEGMEYAREVNKPVFLDFTGYGCVNCRKTEEHIWVRDKIWPMLKNDFVMISLYVDDRRPLEETLYSSVQDKKLRNVGNKWSDFQIANFKQNSQPLYVIMSPEGHVLATPRGYREGVDEYADFLQCGLFTFNQISQRMGRNAVPD